MVFIHGIKFPSKNGVYIHVGLVVSTWMRKIWGLASQHEKKVGTCAGDERCVPP